MTGPRVVIIGAGVVGAALADELSARGWTTSRSSTRAPLPAAGRLHLARPGPGVPDQRVQDDDRARPLHRREARRPRRRRRALLPAGRRAGGGHHPRARSPRSHRRHGWLTAWGVEARLLDAAETCREQHPLLDPERGARRAAGPHRRAGQGGARRRGPDPPGRLERACACCPGTRSSTSRSTDGRVTGVVTDQGELPADIVVCCAGIWGPEIAAHGRHDPAAHPAGAPAGLDRPGAGPRGPRPRRRSGRSCATRTPDLYYRERFDTLGIGYYGHRPMPIRAAGHRPAGRVRGDALGAGVHPGGLRGGLAPRPSCCCPRPATRRSRRASTASSRSPPTTCRCSGESPDVDRASGWPRRSG